MANFSKAFNFRGGFQVDTDVLVVRGQNVGIGSTIPNERLVVDGIVQAEGLKISSLEPVSISTASVGFLTAGLIHVGVTSISNGIITATSTAGVVTYYGDGGRLLNLPTSQWLDVDVGLGFTSIYAQGNVGVDTVDPRFVFQVGGVPYPRAGLNTFQDGVGIETGNIWASGTIQTRGNVSAAQTVNAGQFVGMGSGITALNASNLGVGSIPSNIYGDEIFTGTVYGDLVGTASTAASIALDADLQFDTAIARILQASERVFTPTGRLQVGSDNFASVGDIDIRKTGNSTLYSLSDNGNARIFVGNERQGGPNNGFGGIRFGGNVLNDPLSGAADLDLVNYDVGNVNYYLHAGPTGSGTSGEFRWIYGQSDRVLASMDRLGKFELFGNLNPTDPTLQVAGVASITGDVTVGGGLSVTQNVYFDGNLDVEGDLTLTGNIGITTDSLELPSTTFSGEVIVGGQPELGGGVAITTDGFIRTNDLLVMNGPSTSFSIAQDGRAQSQSSIGCTGLYSEFLIDTPRVVGEEYSGANGFFNNALSGAGFDRLFVSNMGASNLNVTGITSIGSLDINSLAIDGNFQIGNVQMFDIGTPSEPNLLVTAPVQTTEIVTDIIRLSPDSSVQVSVGTTTTPTPSATLFFNVIADGRSWAGSIPLVDNGPAPP